MFTLTAIGHRKLKEEWHLRGPGIGGFVVVKKPATKEREAINPFTREPTTIKAKPARKVLKDRPVKAARKALV